MTTAWDFMTKGTILLCERGSSVYGTKTDNHDQDLTKIYMGSLKSYFGFGEGDSVEYKKDDFDVSGHEFKKFIRLLMKQNPNGLEALWTPSEYMYLCEAEFTYLMRNRELFISKKAYDSFSGYAYSQFKRMTRYKDDPERDAKIESLKSEIRYRETMELHHGAGNYARDPYKNMKMSTLKKTLNDYMGAVHSPGKARKQLMEDFGYSTKNASHLVRLMNMGIEFLENGVLNIDRRGIDAETLIEIKKGEWTLDQVVSHAENLFIKAEEVYNKSKLPEKPDHNKIEQLSIDILSSYHKDEITESKDLLELF
jgi:predicted nucleotidyltransferase